MDNKTGLLSNEQIEALRDLIENYRPRFGVFEKENLFPTILGRLKYALDLCQKLEALAKNPKVVHDLGLVFEKLVKEGVTDYVPNDPNASKQYFGTIATQLQSDFISPLRALISEFGLKKERYSAEDVAALLNKANNFFQLFAGLKDRLFKFSSGTFFSAKMPDGTIIVRPPVELEVLALPFKVTVDELALVAENTNKSIDTWRDNLSKNRTQFIDLVIKTAESNTAKTNLQVTRQTFWLQTSIAGVALLLIALGYFGNLLLENRSLARALEKTETELTKCSTPRN